MPFTWALQNLSSNDALWKPLLTSRRSILRCAGFMRAPFRGQRGKQPVASKLTVATLRVAAPESLVQ